METKTGMFSKILTGVGVACLYVLGLALLLSSGCFVLVGFTQAKSVAWYVFIPIGIALGAAAFFLIRYLLRLNKK